MNGTASSSTTPSCTKASSSEGSSPWRPGARRPGFPPSGDVESVSPQFGCVIAALALWAALVVGVHVVRNGGAPERWIRPSLTSEAHWLLPLRGSRPDSSRCCWCCLTVAKEVGAPSRSATGLAEGAASILRPEGRHPAIERLGREGALRSPFAGRQGSTPSGEPAGPPSVQANAIPASGGSVAPRAGLEPTRRLTAACSTN